MRDTKENCEKIIAMPNPGVKEHVKGFRFLRGYVLLAVSFRVMHNGLTEREATRSLRSGLISSHSGGVIFALLPRDKKHKFTKWQEIEPTGVTSMQFHLSVIFRIWHIYYLWHNA